MPLNLALHQPGSTTGGNLSSARSSSVVPPSAGTSSPFLVSTRETAKWLNLPFLICALIRHDGLRCNHHKQETASTSHAHGSQCAPRPALHDGSEAGHWGQTAEDGERIWLCSSFIDSVSILAVGCESTAVATLIAPASSPLGPGTAAGPQTQHAHNARGKGERQLETLFTSPACESQHKVPGYVSHPRLDVPDSGYSTPRRGLFLKTRTWLEGNDLGLD